MTAEESKYETQRFDPDRHLVDGFCCGGESSLDRWLQHSAAAEAAKEVSSTFVWTPPGSGEVVAYYSLLAHAVTRGDLPSRLGRGVADPVPAALIGKLALHQQLHGQGLGGQLLRDALERLVVASRSGPAFRVVVVDAIDEQAARFYGHFGFKPAPNRPERMLMHVRRVAEALGVNSATPKSESE